MSIEKAKEVLTDGIEKSDWPESEIMKQALAELSEKPEPTEFTDDLRKNINSERYVKGDKDLRIKVLKACNEIDRLTTELKLYTKNFCVAHQPLPEDNYTGCYCCDMVHQAERIKKLEAEEKRLKGMCICMDCGKVIRVTEQSNHLKECSREQSLQAKAGWES